jgi:hypothetical protein
MVTNPGLFTNPVKIQDTLKILICFISVSGYGSQTESGSGTVSGTGSEN